jgi:Ser/Thr protein kinase RdoA (MazF antagonist)
MLEDPVRAEAYADDLAQVLAELHRALDARQVEALAGEPPFAPWPLAPERLRALVGSLPVEIHDRLHRALDRYAELLVAENDLVLVHNDLGTHNLAFDPISRRVVGVLDFEEAARLDRHRDFRYLPSYGPRVLARVLDGYRQRTGVTLSLERIRLLHLATALSFWAWREEDPEAHDRLSSRNRDQALAWIGLALFALD